MDKSVDMTHGPLLGKILKYSIPFALSSIIEQLFITIDVAVVGRFGSSEALAAVGANTFLINLFINLFVGISLGANVLLANLIGQRDNRRIRQAVSTTAMLAIISGFFLLVVGLLAARPMLTAMKTPASIINDAVLFLKIYFLGSPFFMIYNFGASILRSKGDTRRPLNILIVSGIINTVLNLFFVIGLHMTVAGVATATDIAYAFSAFAVVRLLRKDNSPLRLNLRAIRLYPHETKRILYVGIPAGLQGMVFSFSNIFVQSSINSFGPAAIAGASISQNFDAYCYFLLFAFSSACVTFVGQNYGAEQYSRCKRVFWICLAGGAAACLIGNLAFLGFADPLLHLFTTDAAVAHYAKTRMFTVLLFQWTAAAYEIPSAAMRGFGHSLEPALLTIFGTCVLRLVWIFTVLPVWPGYRQLMFCYPISWFLTSIFVGTLFAFYWRKYFGEVKG
ncbi:MAG: MATE family efflux transporter [Prevotellaceae bacterium]|nr:MATE family efflux transporter [Prevotellaceae bacterium]